MGKIDLFEVMFDHPQRVYYAGQWVSGTVSLHLNQPMSMRGIGLMMKGKSSVRFVRGKNTTYESEEVYFKETFLLFGRPTDQSGETEVACGQYVYPFRFLLSSTLPTCYEGTVGHVRYTAKATIDKPRKFDHVTKEAFTVLGTLNLNHEKMSLREPSPLKQNLSVAYGCCISGSAEWNVTINKRCFVPGEAIFFSGEVINRSNTTIKKATAAIVQTVTFTATDTQFWTFGEAHTLVVEIDVATIDRPPIQPSGVDTWNNIPLFVPSLPPSRLDGCNIIDIAYKFKFSLNVTCTKNLESEVPLIIGTIPVVGTFALMPAVVTNQPTAPPLEQPFAHMQNIAPPTYEESSQGKINIREVEDPLSMRDVIWAPSYPTYRQFSYDAQAVMSQINITG